jgi:alpha-N-arabinofuranosidase
MSSSDASAGTGESLFRTIQRAADLAQPGDIMTVHAGIYRERNNPPCCDESSHKRIVYQCCIG